MAHDRAIQNRSRALSRASTRYLVMAALAALGMLLTLVLGAIALGFLLAHALGV